MTGETTFGPFVLDFGRRALLQSGKTVALGQRGLALLNALVSANGEIVSKADLMEAAWPGTLVEEGNLAVQMANLRKALGTREDGQEWIATVPRFGYRLVLPVERTLASGTQPTIAVFPFDNLSGDPGQDYFANGVVEDLITALSRFRNFAVVSRGASFKHRSPDMDMRTIAVELGVRYVLEGSVRRAGDRLRVTAHLAEAATGTHLWGRTFDGVVADIFDVQDQITDQVAGVIEPQIRRAETERSRRKHPDTLEVYDLALQARALLYLDDPVENARAYALCLEAIAREPNYAHALNIAAWTLHVRRLLNWEPLTSDDRTKILELSERAAVHCDGDPEVLVQRADLLIQVAEEFEEGIQLARYAVAANPNNLFVVTTAAIDNLMAGDLDDAIALASHVIELSAGDPNLAVAYSALAHMRLITADYLSARDLALQAVTLNRNLDFAYWMLIAANAHLGEMDRARKWLATFLALRPGITIAGIAAGQRPRWPERVQPILDGLRLAGMPEGEADLRPS